MSKPSAEELDSELDSLIGTARVGKCRYCRTMVNYPDEDAAIIRSYLAGTRAWAAISNKFLAPRGIDLGITHIQYHFRENHHVEG